jgi:uncharacterized protein (DUF2141 family)
MKKYAFLLLIASSAQALDLKVNGLSAESDSGTYRCLLFKSELGFPGDIKTAVQSDSGSVKDQTGICNFKNIEPGIYAVSTFHDENDNDKLDTYFFGAPKESYGFSNNASRPFSAPSFNEAAFEIKENKTIRINLK